ncbi:GerAB/ArcD/ProY family transporter [Cytobacillus suaedae]|nr:GerAB/ArcD/ProY family transporter [Cytobacillus suaedae]
MQQKDKVGIREFIAITIIIIGVKLSDDTPDLLLEDLKSAAWMAPFLSGLIAIVPIVLLIKVLGNYEGKNLHDINVHLLGKFVGGFVSITLLLLGSAAMIIDSRGYVNIINTLYFTKTPTPIIYLLLMVTCAYGARRGIQNIGSVAWLVLFYIKFALIMAFILALQEGHVYSIFPFFGVGIEGIIRESALKVSIYADILYLALIFPFVTTKSDFKKGVWISLLILIIEVSISMMLYIFIFDYESVQMLNYPFHEMIRYIKLGTFLTNIETFFFPIWLLATFIRFSVYLYLNGVLFGGIFKIKEFEYVIPSLATVYLLAGLAPETATYTTFFLRENLLNITSPLFISLPILLWIMAKVKGDFKNEKKG